MPSRRFLAPLLLAAGLFIVASANTTAAPQDELVWRGDHATGRTIMEDISKEYARQKLGKISLQPFSTISGLDAVNSGSADIAGSARGKYARRAEEANLEFAPVALDAAVLVTHPKNPVRSLTLKQVYDIYFGRIKNWKELGGADKDINLYGIATPLDGVEYSLRELVYRKGDQPVAVPRLYLNTTKLEEAITLDPAGLGLSTLANIWNNKGVRAMAIEGVEPSVRTVTDGSYPLYITLYTVNRADSPKQAAIDRYRAFLATPAVKQILTRHQLIPYTDAAPIVARNEDRMKFIDARVGRDEASVAAIAAIAPPPTPVSAPRATLSSAISSAPTSAATVAARENLARAEAKKAADKPVVKKAEPARPKVAKTAPAKKPAPKAVPKAAPKAAPKPAPKAEAPKASFGNVTSGGGAP